MREEEIELVIASVKANFAIENISISGELFRYATKDDKVAYFHKLRKLEIV